MDGDVAGREGRFPRHHRLNRSLQRSPLLVALNFRVTSQEAENDTKLRKASSSTCHVSREYSEHVEISREKRGVRKQCYMHEFIAWQKKLVLLYQEEGNHHGGFHIFGLVKFFFYIKGI